MLVNFMLVKLIATIRTGTSGPWHSQAIFLLTIFLLFCRTGKSPVSARDCGLMARTLVKFSTESEAI
jgi:hypothetical protein